MSKAAVVFWSGTGNTEMMSGFVADGVREAGGEPSVYTASDFSSEMMDFESAKKLLDVDYYNGKNYN